MLFFKSFLEIDLGSKILKHKPADTDFSSSLVSHTYSLVFLRNLLHSFFRENEISAFWWICKYLLWIELRLSVEEESYGRLLHCDKKDFQ